LTIYRELIIVAKECVMEFLYYLSNSAGWADVIFEHENVSLNYDVDYCLKSDIEDLLGGILTLVEYKKDSRYFDYWEEKYLDENNNFIWHISEGGMSVDFFFLKTEHKEIVNLKIIELYVDDNITAFEGEINIFELIDCILYSCSEMIRKYGIYGYYENFWNEFPIYYYLMLHDYRNKSINIDWFNETINNELEGMNKSSIEDEIKILFGDNNLQNQTNLDNERKDLVHKAVVFATQKHAGTNRKGTNLPYITHPMEVMQILIVEGCPEEVIVAGILHDTLEDTKTTKKEILDLFGENILKIVAAESEDKSKTWKERKQTTIDNLPEESLEAKLVCCADKLANLRAMAADRKTMGEKLWERFNADKSDIAWYYQGIVAVMTELEKYRMYAELRGLLGEVFG
jgi:hypothetical protein